MSTRARRLSLYAGAAALLAGITWIDYATGYELGFFIFYFFPIALAAWYGSRAAGVAFAVAAGVCWYLSDRLSLHPYSHALLIYWETFMRMVSFLTIALTLSHIRRDSRMNAMIEDLLDSAREESQQLRPEVGPIDVGAYLSELLDRSAPLLDVRRIRLTLDEAGGLIALADPNHLDRIILNLLSNALKYSPPERPVELGAAVRGAVVDISVEDHGPGIPSEDLPHIFDRFYRGQRTAARGGLGIGLYSVRLLVEAHGGTARVEPGRAGGTAFHVALPAATDRMRARSTAERS